MSHIDPFEGKPTEGIVRGSDVEKSSVEIRKRQLSQATRLVDLQEEFAIYTPAMVYLHVPLPGDVMSSFYAQYGQEVEVFSVDLDRPVFSGLSAKNGDNRWNQVLFGMPKEHWPAFYNWMGTIALMDHSVDTLYRVRTQDITVPDPFCFQNEIVLPDDIPTGKITVFCVETNKGCHYCLSSNGIKPAKAIFDDKLIYEDTEKFAEACRAGVNPYDTLDI